MADVKRANSPQDESAVVDLRREWSTIVKRNLKAGGVGAASQRLILRGRTIWIADAHRDDGKRFVVRAEDLLTALILPFAYLGALR